MVVMVVLVVYQRGPEFRHSRTIFLRHVQHARAVAAVQQRFQRRRASLQESAQRRGVEPGRK